MIVEIASVPAGANWDVQPSHAHLVANCGGGTNNTNIYVYDTTYSVLVAVDTLAYDYIGGTSFGLPLRRLLTTNACYTRMTNTHVASVVMRYQALDI